ncbi:MAG: NTP transferase domain-containing protein [bacterium]|nr:NTP transferase domain-containing protein [bacterium]
MTMKAIILAGGKGTRLKPYTYILPKPLVPVGEKPILAVLINQLKKYGINDLVLCVNHMAELIMSYFGNGDKFGVNISYSMESDPLGTIGPLKLIKDLPENFLLMNGDLLTDIDFTDLYDFHMKSGAPVTVGYCTREVNIDFGVMEIANHRITGFVEKPRYDYMVSMGVYVFNKRVMDYVPENTPFGFDNLMLKLLEKKEPINAYPFGGYWLDIGRPEDFERANNDIESGTYTNIF